MLGLFYAILLLLLGYLLYKRFLVSNLSIATSLFLIVPGGFSGWMFGSHHWLVDILSITSAIFLLSSDWKKKKFIFIVFRDFWRSGYFCYARSRCLLYHYGIRVLFFSKKPRKYFYYSFFVSALTFVFLSSLVAFKSGLSQIIYDWVYFPLFFYTKTHKNGFGEVLTLLKEEWNASLIKMAPYYFVPYALRNSMLLLSPIFSLGSFWLIWKKKILPSHKFSVLTAITFSFMLGGFHRLAPSNMTWGFASTLPIFVLLDYYFGKEKIKK